VQKKRAIGSLDHERIVRVQRDEFGLHAVETQSRRAQKTSVIAGLLVSQHILPVSDGGWDRTYVLLAPKPEDNPTGVGRRT
jgi:hypothetical protein